MTIQDNPGNSVAGSPDRVSESLKRVARLYTVCPARAADRSELVTFLKAAYADQFNASEYQDEEKIAGKWDWANIKNPNRDSFTSTAWICRENTSKRIVGHFGIIPISLKYRADHYPAAWGRDLIVLPEFRRLGVGPLLVMSVLKEIKDKAAIFLIAGVRDHVYSMYKKFGFTDMGYIPLYAKVNRLNQIVRGKIGDRLFTSLLSLPGSLAMELFYMPSRIRRYFCLKHGNVRIAEIVNFDNTFDGLWKSASASFGLTARRDSSYLNWRFVDQPYRDYKMFKAVCKGSDDPAGYVVLREGESRGLRTGVISDIFASANDQHVIRSLIHFAASHFAKRDDIALIRCDILNKEIGRILKSCGFIKVASRERFMFTNVKEGLDITFFKDRDNWFLDYSDSDLDLSGRTNA